MLKTVTFREPRIPVISNVTAEPFKFANGIAAMLTRQLVEPVRWEDTLTGLLGMGKDKLYELGPGAQIRAMIKRISLEGWKATQTISP